MKRILLLAPILALGSLGAFIATGVASATTTTSPSVLTCAGKTAVKPTSYVLACADGNSEFINIKWSSWSATGAHATATYRANTCEPSCVAGKFVNYPATVTFSKPQTTSHGSLFSAVAYTYSVSSTSTLPLTALGNVAGGA